MHGSFRAFPQGTGTARSVNQTPRSVSDRSSAPAGPPQPRTATGPPRWGELPARPELRPRRDRKSTRLNSRHGYISYAVFCLKKKKKSNFDFFYIKKKKNNHTNQQK